MLTDQVVDLLEERADVAIRAGPLRNSQLIARKLWQSRMVVVAAPAYLAAHGTPQNAGGAGWPQLPRFLFHPHR